MPQLEFRMPDLGEGLTEADLVTWLVAEGDHIELNQTIAEVETAKAMVELPSPYAGIVAELIVDAGDTVPVGAPIIRVATEGSVPEPAPADPVAAEPDLVEPAAEEPKRQPVLVGYGPGAAEKSRRRKPGSEVKVQDAEPAMAVDHTRPDAKPSARKLARELGVDLATVTPAGHAITVDDVRGQTDSVVAAPTTTDRETRTKIAGVRKWTAEAMVTSSQTIPHVTEFVTVDVTASVELIEQLRTTKAFKDLKLTPLALVAKTILVALQAHPSLNSSWDEAAHEIVTKNYVNLGIAVAGPRGLLVPSIKEAQAMSLVDLTGEITALATKARNGDATPADLRGGTFSITNIGVFGIDSGTPLINPGEAAILCLGSIRKRPWVVDDELAVRSVTTLGLSFDHRLVDGEQGSKFLADVAAMLEDPLTLIGRA
ncbi:2-oxo acid dehydrogenase subunit E2 [Antrihabitans sp. YC3-6]|uniref:Dihydrolipoamide acetyltransferase component of pyruvate dehydrogenase complex n=1 Tax=Antrihabitans stalagmiti TaxID=2799499 RepID=A0A934NTU9_9NOCA|nr:dihydrolipoamide acetyltransferase family protein [Antrihabitans stalagmiti]MBJ8341107.1 2-oxo acid dehydrogenase subunit E2 [Antrihabitans stalagmiti]